MRYKKLIAATMLSLCLCVVTDGVAIAADNGESIRKKRLQIVFMFGQSEMVGQAKVPAASYMLQKPLVPPRDVTLNAHKGLLHQINSAYLYWQAMHSYGGPKEKKKELKALLAERDKFRKEFKQYVLDEMTKNDGMFRGKHYAKRRGFWLFNMVDMEAEKVGITPKIRAILDGSDNSFNVDKAYEQILADSGRRYLKQLELNKLFLNGTTSKDFDAFAAAAKKFEAQMKTDAAASIEQKRLAYAELAEKHLHMPIAKRTHVVGMGTIASTPESDAGNMTHGRLSVGYGSGIDTFGLEYAAGITLEGMIDAPILIVKCAFNDPRASIGQMWRSSSLDGVEAPDKSGKPVRAWERILSRVKAILDNPEKYHPDYDPQAGYDVAGLIWFQGLGDSQNAEYALHLEAMLSEFRTFVKSPEMPVVCATVGTMMFQGQSDDSLVNKGMRQVANMPAFKGTIDVVETYKCFPSEFSVLGGLFHKRKLSNRSGQGNAMQETINQATNRRAPYMGSASFYLLAGNEVSASLAKMIGGEKPVVPIR